MITWYVTAAVVSSLTASFALHSCIRKGGVLVQVHGTQLQISKVLLQELVLF
jgi:hypothetical protein